MNLDQIILSLRFIAEHLANGLILSSAIFVGSVVAFRWFFRAQRWSASTRYQTSLILGVRIFPLRVSLSNVESHDWPFQALIKHVLDRLRAKKLSNHLSCLFDHGSEWTANRVRAPTPVRPFIQSARQRGDLAIEQFNDLQHGQLRGPFAQRIAAPNPSFTGENSMVSQSQEDLLEEFDRNMASLGEFLNLVNFAGGILSNDK
jgi:hypothetical protein